MSEGVRESSISKKAPHPADRVQPAHTEPMARDVVRFLGGPMGRFARIGRARWWTPLRVLISVAWVFLAFGVLSKANCAGGARTADGVIGLNWAGNRQYTSFCYNDITPLYGGRGLDQPGFVYAYSWVEGDLTRYMEYPVLAGLFQGVMGWIARNTYGLVDSFLPGAGWYFYLTAFVLSIMWICTIRMVAELAGNRIWDTVLVAASPLVIVHAFTNWDIPSIMFLVAALLLARNKRFLWAGVMIGAGTAFKMWPLFVLGAYLVVAIRKRNFVPFFKMLFTSVATWLVINVPVMLSYPQAWAEFTRLNSERSWEWTTIYAVISRMTGWSGFDSDAGTPEILNAVTLVLFAAACLGILILGLKAPRTPRVAELLFLIVAFFLLFNKVWSPQYSLWLVIPAMLALPYWRLLFSWMTVDMMVWPILMWHMLGSDNNGLPGEVLNLVVLVRDGFIVAMIVLVITQILGNIPDKVAAAHHGHDPLLTSPNEWVQKD
nr:glycosyltransferase 87 family protein [Corynebacterium lubricantis]